MSKWMVRKPYKMANGNYRPRVGNDLDERKTLSEFQCSTEKEARKKALEWIIRQENLSDENYIKDKNITIRQFIDSYFYEWRTTNFVAPPLELFIRYLEHHNWMDTKLSSITTKWCVEYRRRIPDFKQKNGSEYKLQNLYKNLVAELSHLLQQAKYEEYVVNNYNSRLTNPNKHLVKDEHSEQTDRAFEREDKIWTREKLNKYLPKFKNIPSTRVHTTKNTKEPRKANIKQSDNAEAWKVYWTDNDGGFRSKNFNWKKEGGKEIALRKAEVYAERITSTLVQDEINVVEKGQFDGIDTIMWFAFFNISFQLGLRVGEIAGLKLSDFSADGKFVSIKRQRTIRKKQIVEDSPKANSKRRITVPKSFREQVLPLLREYHHMNGTAEYDYVLQYRNGGAIRPDYWNKQYKRVQKLVGIPKEDILPSTHSGRHTHLTLLAEKNVSIQYLQKRAGHRSIKTTANYYIHLATDQEASDKWDEEVYLQDELVDVENG